MKKIFVILNFLVLICNASDKKIRLAEEIELHLFISDYNPNEQIVREFEENIKYHINFLDGKIFFGTDDELPSTRLDSAYIYINSDKIKLDVSYMYDPISGSEEPNPDYFKINKYGKILEINGLFSDGAGAYIAQWIIIVNKSFRTIISDDERIYHALFE